MEQELKNGTYNFEYSKFYEPIFTKVKTVDLKFCNSENVTLVRGADIVANKIYFISLNGGDFSDEIKNRHMYITRLP